MPEENKIKKEDPKVELDTSGPEVDITLPEEKKEEAPKADPKPEEKQEEAPKADAKPEEKQEEAPKSENSSDKKD